MQKLYIRLPRKEKKNLRMKCQQIDSSFNVIGSAYDQFVWWRNVLESRETGLEPKIINTSYSGKVKSWKNFLARKSIMMKAFSTVSSLKSINPLRMLVDGLSQIDGEPVLPLGSGDFKWELQGKYITDSASSAQYD